MNKLKVKWHKSIKEIPQNKWSSLLREKTAPFFDWEWLNALESSKSVSPYAGWQPLFLILWEGDWPIAAAPLYLKAHSFGEFVYDHQFAELARNLNLEYYPKIVGMSPFSPIEGYRFFFKKGVNQQELTIKMMEIIDTYAMKNNIISSNFLYVDPEWLPIAEAAKCNKWINQKSLWASNGEDSYSEYLTTFNSSQRRNIKRERKSIKDKGININVIKDNHITSLDMKRMHYFYQQHCAKWGIWGSKYLSESFFEKMTSPSLINRIILFCAYEGNDEEPIAMSLCIKSQDMLWGRYWGTKKNIDFLHFELCYYSPMEWAIENGMRFFDPGAGGGHKRRRGFLAKEYASMHRWYVPEMESLIKDWLPKVNKAMIDEIKLINNDVPFKTKNTQVR